MSNITTPEFIDSHIHEFVTTRQDDDLDDLTVDILRALSARVAELEADALRYQWLRSRDLDTIHKGGVFAGQTPENFTLNGKDLDNAIDFAMSQIPHKIPK